MASKAVLRNPLSPPRFLQWLSELFFAAYLALLVVALGSQSDHPTFVYRLGGALYTLCRPLIRFWSGRSAPLIRQGTDLILHEHLVWCFLSLAVFAFFHMLGRIRVLKAPLNYGVAIIVVAGFPLVCLHLGVFRDFPNTSLWLISLELAGVLAGAFRYVHRGQPPIWAFSLIVMAHSVFWVWLVAHQLMFYLLSLNVLGVIWSLYLLRQRAAGHAERDCVGFGNA